VSIMTEAMNDADATCPSSNAASNRIRIGRLIAPRHWLRGNYALS
jgi:hypothetical protein